MKNLREKTTGERRAEWRAFREKFLEEIPVGTAVENTNLYGVYDKMFFATTAPGGIYESERNEYVVVVDINGEKGNNGLWTAGFIQKRKEV